ncbi:ChaN family lipoprotein [Vibrio sinaloensis]|uniref:ChaN family lipoprotein n=1 Tax=Photobacterium sp. (strain ATCC 43367) TaxID=379097 RepID=UPI0035EC330F
MRNIFATSLIAFFLTACSTTSNQAPNTFYDYQLFAASGQLIDVDKLPASITDADVILVGEWHTHTGVHRFQTDLLEQLIDDKHNVALSMEQFSRDKQNVVDEYLAGTIGEQVLMKNGNAWPNYESDYRPLIELAKSRDIDVIAANAPKPIVRCIGRQGVDYLNKLTDKERRFLASEIDTAASPYKEKFMASMHHGKPEQTEKQFAAQVTWDETMAESIVNYLAQNPSSQVMHIAGKFHTEQGLGTKESILKRNPNLKVLVVTPVAELDNGFGDDYRLKVLAPPVRYVQMENRMAAYKNLKGRNDNLVCR